MIDSSAYHLVPVMAEDEEFLFHLFTQTFGAQLINSGLPEELVAPLVEKQFQAKEVAYHNDYPEALHSIIKLDVCAVGQIRVNRGPEEIRLVDISVLPEHQGKGIGRKVIKALLRSAEKERMPVTLTVERRSPARLLYEHLGFEVVKKNSVYYFMANFQ